MLVIHLSLIRLGSIGQKHKREAQRGSREHARSRHLYTTPPNSGYRRETFTGAQRVPVLPTLHRSTVGPRPSQPSKEHDEFPTILNLQRLRGLLSSARPQKRSEMHVCVCVGIAAWPMTTSLLHAHDFLGLVQQHGQRRTHCCMLVIMYGIA